MIILATILVTDMTEQQTSGEHLAVASANFSIGRVRVGIVMWYVWDDRWQERKIDALIK